MSIMLKKMTHPWNKGWIEGLEGVEPGKETLAKQKVKLQK